MSTARSLRIAAAATALAGSAIAMTGSAEAGSGQFATILLQQRYERTGSFQPPASHGQRPSCGSCYAKPAPAPTPKPQVTRRDHDDDDDAPKAKRRVASKPEPEAKREVVAARAAPPKPQVATPASTPVRSPEPKVAAVPPALPITQAPVVTPAMPGSDTSALPPVEQAEPGVELSTPIVEGGPTAPVSGEPIRTANAPAVAPEAPPAARTVECRRFLPSVGQTITVSCTE